MSHHVDEQQDAAFHKDAPRLRENRGRFAHVVKNERQHGRIKLPIFSGKIGEISATNLDVRNTTKSSTRGFEHRWLAIDRDNATHKRRDFRSNLAGSAAEICNVPLARQEREHRFRDETLAEKSAAQVRPFPADATEEALRIGLSCGEHFGKAQIITSVRCAFTK
jgi:hypothetical protein